MASSSNIYDLLNNDEQHSKKAVPKDGPGKPDKSDQRRSVPKQHMGTAAPTPDQREPHQRHRVDDRDRRGGRGGASRGGRGGRGGYHGIESDGQRRNFDRKQGEHHKHAPGEARKHGAVGEVDPSSFSGSSVQEFAAADASIVADANADQVGLDIPDVVAIEDPEDSKMTLDQYIASRAVPEDDINRQTREVTNDGDFRAAKAFVRDEESTFYDAVKSPKDGEEAKKEKKEKKGPKKMSLFEMLGDIPAASSSSSSSRGGRGGFDGQRGGRGGFDGQRGGRGGFQGERRGGYQGGEGGRGGRGGFNGQRGGRGGAAPRGGRPAANVNLADQSAFPSL